MSGYVQKDVYVCMYIHYIYYPEIGYTLEFPAMGTYTTSIEFLIRASLYNDLFAKAVKTSSLEHNH